MSKPCAGAGMVPSIFMPYPFPPFWMYPQMAYQMYLQSLSHPYSWGLPYDYYENSYFSSYCSGRGNNWGTGSSNLHQPTSSVSAGETDNRNESVATRIEEDDLEQELVIVDEDNANEQS